MQWLYQNKTLKTIPEGAVGFIYKITRISDGKFYIGKKVLLFHRKKKLTKAEKLLVENKRKIYKIVQSQSNWENYWGSSKELIQDIKDLGKEAFLKEIIEFCFSKRTLTYREVWHQFKNDVLEAHSYNANILSRFFKQKE